MKPFRKRKMVQIRTEEQHAEDEISLHIINAQPVELLNSLHGKINDLYVLDIERLTREYHDGTISSYAMLTGMADSTDMWRTKQNHLHQLADLLNL